MEKLEGENNTGNGANRVADKEKLARKLAGKLGKAAKLASDFSYIARQGEGTSLKDNPGALRDRVVRPARDFSHVAVPGEGTSLKDNPDALKGGATQSEPEGSGARAKVEVGKSGDGAKVEVGKSEDGVKVEDEAENRFENKFRAENGEPGASNLVKDDGGGSVAESKEVKIEDKPIEAKEGEHEEGEKEKGDKNAWRAYRQDSELRYEGGKIIYRDKESGKVWENGEEVAGSEKGDEVEVPEVGWRAWSEDGYLRHRYEDGKLVYTDKDGRTWVNGEERKKVAKKEGEDVTTASWTGGSEETAPEAAEVEKPKEKAEPKVEVGPKVERVEPKASEVEKPEEKAESKVEVEPKVERVEPEASEVEKPKAKEVAPEVSEGGEPEIDLDEPEGMEELKEQAPNLARIRFEKNSQRLAEAREIDDVGEKVRLLKEVMKEMPEGGKLWHEANDMLRKIEPQGTGGESEGVNREGSEKQEEDDDRAREAAMETLEPEDGFEGEDDGTRVMSAEYGGGGGVERKQTLRERLKGWVKKHPRASKAIAGAAALAIGGIAFAVRGHVKESKVANTWIPTSITQNDSSRNSRRARGVQAGGNAVTGDSLKSGAANTAGAGTAADTASGNSVSGKVASGNATSGNAVNNAPGGNAQNTAGATGGNTAQNAGASGGNVLGNSVQNVATTGENAAANGGAAEDKSGGNGGEAAVSQGTAENAAASEAPAENSAGNAESANNGAAGETAADKWQPSEDMIRDGENYLRIIRSDTVEQIPGTNNWKVGEVEKYDSEGNLTGLVSIVAPNGILGIEDINFNNLNDVTGLFEEVGTGNQLMFVEYNEAIQDGENDIIGEVRVLDESGNEIRKAPIVALGGDRGITNINFDNTVPAGSAFNVSESNQNNVEEDKDNRPEGVSKEAWQDSGGRWIDETWYGQVNSYRIMVGGELRQIEATGETQVYDSEGNYLGKTFYLTDGTSLWVPLEDVEVRSGANAEATDVGVANAGATASVEAASVAEEAEMGGAATAGVEEGEGEMEAGVEMESAEMTSAEEGEGETGADAEMDDGTESFEMAGGDEGDVELAAEDGDMGESAGENGEAEMFGGEGTGGE